MNSQVRIAFMTKTFNLSGLIRTKSVLISIIAFAVNTADAQAGPFSHWGFNEGSGTNALDSVDANNGTIYGGALYDPNNKIEGTHSLLLNGVNNYVGLFEPPA